MVMKENNDKLLRILAVDDEEAILGLYRDALSFINPTLSSEYDFEVVLCEQGDEALETVRKAKDKDKPFSVIFLDLNLPPGPDGLWAGEEIRKLDPYVNFVIVTGLLNIDPREISLRIPPEDKILYIQKPFHIQELRQFASALGAKWKSEMLLRKANEELENVNNQLMETNNALSVLARNLDRTRKESEKRVIQRTRNLIIPIIKKLQQGKNMERYKNDLYLLVDYVENLTSDLAGDVKIAASLSTTEMRLASMIRSGMSSEEIAEHLYISLSTVKTHRKNIRRKLNLRNSNINLRAYLESEMDEG